ncbi:MAG: porin [Rhodanobacteraceae bacterium]
MRRKIVAAVVIALCTGSGVAAADGMDLDFSGKMYFDVTHVDQKNSETGKTDATGFGIDVKRFYLTVQPKFNDVWSANLTTDFKYVNGDGITNLYVKKAYVQGKFSKAAVFRVGSADMPWIPFVESYYGYRYVENTLVDRLKFGNSADWGLHLGGDVGANGSLKYAVSAVNGGGYKHPDRSKSMDIGGRVGWAPMDGMIVAVGAYSGKLGKDTQSAGTLHTASRSDVMVAWARNGLRVGGEYFQAKNWNNVLDPLSDKADGYSVWGSQEFGDKYAVFARYDTAKLSKDLDSNAKDTYYNMGLQYQVTKGFKLSAVYKYEKRESTIASATPVHVGNVRTNEIGVWGEVKF